MALTYQEERLRECLPEAMPLLTRHWEEIARNKDTIPLSPSFEKLEQLERLQSLCICTVRQVGKLVGYADFVVDRALNYPVLMAESHVFWIDPACRLPRVAHRLFRFAEGQLKRRGARIVHIRAKNAHPSAGRVLSSIGFEPIETVFAKLL